MPFEYKAELPLEDGGTEPVVLVFKDIALLPIGVARKHRGSGEDQMWAMFEWGLSDEQLELFDRIPQPQLPQIIAAWREAEGVDLGESSASPPSSTGTVGHSKQTSSETGSD
jgi:hypothetical protein